ncbi:hypothetical protein ORV05_31230 [Amycolatopsis cynarae]|uniref:Uncharacterized protein n=2 Tax=Amycolatopsis TaxID=1813 RepID=A0A558CTY2_9PSEU|nr:MULTISPECIES: hypothetical protein [Amycolatopsis]TVT52231.1 hypothetical protein FNH05_13255 [Amycolatopsis rhizosphaerae]WAL65328.1 hypothetical protein ORV05_31230 [Amycolatopsis sp. HUAS 11-8]
MAGVDDIRAGIQAAKEKCNASLAALQQAAQDLEQAQQILAQVTSGSNHAAVNEATGLLNQARDGVNSQQGTITAAIDSAESYAQQL